MANVTPGARGWQLIEQAEVALFKENSYAKAEALAALARAYFETGASTDNQADDGLSAWFTYAAGGTSLAPVFAAQTATGATAPTDSQVLWTWGDGKGIATITTKELTSNVAKLTTSANHGFAMGDKVLVALNSADAVFDGLQTITAVTATTFSFAKTNANVTAAATGGTAQQAGLSATHTYAAAGTYAVSITAAAASLPSVTYSRNVAIPYAAP